MLQVVLEFRPSMEINDKLKYDLRNSKLYKYPFRQEVEEVSY